MSYPGDAASVISNPSHRSHRSKPHRSDREHRKHRSDREHRKSRSRSRDHSRDRHARHHHHGGGGSAVGAASAAKGGIAGYAASFFGLGDEGDDDGAYGYGEDYSQSLPRERSHKSSKHRDRGSDDDARSFFSGIGIGGGGGHGHDEHHGGKSKDRGFFGLTGGNASRSSFFSGFGGRSSTPSYYKRSPRPNFVARMTKKLKRLLRDLVYYAKRHPLKVFMVIIMPLVTGGFLTALLAKVGIKLPKFVERMMGMAAKGVQGDGIGLVGDAVKMVKGGGGSSSSRGGVSGLAKGLGGALGGGGVAGAAVNYAKTTLEKGSGGGMQWERRSVEKDFLGHGGGAAVKGIAKMFS